MTQPSRMANTNQLPLGTSNGAIWKLQPEQRDLDANVISLAPGAKIQRHQGPEIDVVLHILTGSGELISDTERITLEPGDIIYLPARSQREFIAHETGLAYFSVHQRKRTTGLMPKLRSH
ncbi:cupin domain-containing protein [Glutamicibacter sp. JC586]|uniref:cupin domain-containing protein n=1 Tax=Glutamicibacter sp. JC586 TaxID=2590552 RepID=UPI001356EE22|nr:cupin domain-containing protein [Glutamicibacter sp. JC586]